MRQIGAKMDKALPHLVAVFIVAVCIVLTWYFLPMGVEKEKYIPLATFYVLAITLVALVYYAHDTRRIADVTRKNWELEAQPRCRHSVDMVPVSAQPYSGRTSLTLTNLSGLMLYAKVQCNFRIYGDPVKEPEGFDGTIWKIFPYQSTWSYFEIESLLSIKRESIDNIRSKKTPENRQIQLTVDLKLEFKNELGQRSQLPVDHRFFDFELGIWVPQVTIRDQEAW